MNSTIHRFVAGNGPAGCASGSGLSLLQRLAKVAQDCSQSTAIVFLADGEAESAELRTFIELQDRARRVAAALVQQVHAGDRVLLLLSPGADFFAAVWGCLLANVVVVPAAVPRLDAQVDFVGKIIADSGAALVLTDRVLTDSMSALREKFSQTASNLVWLTLEQALLGSADVSADVNATADWEEPAATAPALLQYTSGSTGMPKGVIVTHGNLAASIDLMLGVAAIDADSTVVSWLPLFHNMGFISFGLLPLCVGARLVLMPTESFMLNPARWFKAISHFRGTHSGAPNIGYESCLNFLPDALLDQLDLSSWKVAAIGSEPLKANLIDRFAARFSRCGFRAETFLTTYGFSEATVFSAGSDHRTLVPRLDVDKDAFESSRILPPLNPAAVKTLVSVGVAGSHIAIVDPENSVPCADREMGEIWIRGGTVAAGYWNKPDISAETFGIYTCDGAGPYVRSGDIGMMADGDLYVVGRRKELIIVGSKKLHPLDIEQVVNGVSPAFVPYATAATAWHYHDSEVLAVFQELKPDVAPADQAALVTAIGDSVFERFAVNVGRVILLRMGSLPRTHNGKLQRIRCCDLVDNGTLGANVLLDWRGDGDAMANTDAADVSARAMSGELSDESSNESDDLTPTRQQLMQLWTELLNRPTVALDDDFVSLGGQSIIATRMVAKLRQVFAVDLTIRSLFRYSTVRRLAHHIDCLLQADANVSDGIAAPAALRPVSADGWLPLSSAQQRLWLLSQFDSATAAYHMCASFRMEGVLHRPALEQALALLVERHPMLRTVYRRAADGSAQQRVLENFAFAVEFHADPAQQDAVLQAARIRPFDLTHDLMLRACLLRIGPQSHILSLTVHHIAADGWSVGILVRELMALYPAFASGQQPVLTPPGGDYVDWCWQHEQVAAQKRYPAQLEYWLQQLRDLPECHALPLDRSRADAAAFCGQSWYSQVSRERLEQLNFAARQQGVTLFMQLQTALAVLVARLAGGADDGGCQDVAIGAAYANRAQSGCEDIVGFFVNSLVMRHGLAADCTLAQLLKNCRDTVLDAYEHADVPFESIVGKINPRRRDNLNPLFQIMLNLQDKSSWNLQLPGLDIEPFQVSTQEAKFDLAVDCTQGADGISIQWEFNSQLFNAATIQRWAAYFDRILDAICNYPDQAWERVPLLPTDERQWLLQDLNATAQPVHHVCIHTLFEQQVAMRPDAVALVCGDLSLSYAQLNQRANALAHCLLALGVKPEDRVVIVLERSADSVISMLAVLKAGAAYVPVDPAYPRERIDFIVQDACPAVVVTHSALQDALKPGDIPVLLADMPAAQLHDNPDDTSVLPHHLAYVIYTSGSTGQPKGAMLEHRQVANLVLNDQHAPLAVEDVVAHCANPAFDAATWEIWATLTRGARLVVIPPSMLLQPAELARELCVQRVTAMVMTVALFNQYRVALAPALRQLKYCLIGGEAVDARVALDVLQQSPPAHLINIYGPTEATVFVATHDIRPESISARAVPIGRPVANTRLYILDRFGEPVPTGVTGEICVAGAQVGRGYWNRPELTAQRFGEDPFVVADQQAESGRLYKTGDLGRWRADGVLEYVGRNDFQIKLRGFRIEAGEIENALRQCAGVRDAVVMLQRDGIAEPRLVAYLVADNRDDDAAWLADISAQLAVHLPDYMIPAAYVTLLALPLTAHGKLDRRALPTPDFTAAGAAPWQSPQGESEQQLAQVWQTVLGVPAAGRHDNFFALGGHSLLAVRLSEQLRQLGYRLDVRTIFRATTLAEMATYLVAAPALSDESTGTDALDHSAIDPATTRITPDQLPLLQLDQTQIDSIVAEVRGGVSNIQDIYPLSPLQEGILFHHLLTPEQDPYLLRTIMTFDSRAALDDFLQALEVVVARHDILRSSLHWQDLPAPVQVVERKIQLVVNECRARTGVPVETTLLDHLEQQRAHFDMRHAPLLNVSSLHEPDSSRWWLGILAHHVIADHQTLQQIFAEILLILQGQPEQLPAVIPFRRYIASQQQMSSQWHEEFFHRQLAGYDQPVRLFDVQQDEADRHHTREAQRVIDPVLTAQLRDLARQQRVTMAAVVHLAWGLVLGACSGRHDLVFGTVLSGRIQAEAGADQVPGLFINTLPVRLQLAQQNAADTLQQVYQHLNELTEHEQAPLALARRCSAVAPDAPLFNVLLNYRHKSGQAEAAVAAAMTTHGMRVSHMEERTHYAVTLCVDECEQELQLGMQTVSSIDPHRLLHYCQTALQNLVRAVQQADSKPASAISVLPASERENLLHGFNAHDELPAFPELVHVRFEQQAEQTPDAIALVHGNRRLNYRQLNARANAIAHRLLEQGVRPNDRVAVCLERSADLVATLIGILKAGAGYVPLDPTQPVARLYFMLQDSEPFALITSTALQTQFAVHNVPLICIDHVPDFAFTNPCIAGLQPQDLAYVIYTSGSTGQPKGVMVEHRQIARLFAATQTLFHFDAQDVWTLFHSCAFDFSVWEMWGALLHGARLLVVPAEMTRMTDEFYRMLCRERVTVLNQTPGALRALLSAQDDVAEPHALRYVILGGEALEPHLIESWQALNPLASTRLINMYGITEITVHGTFADVTDYREETATGLIGLPLPGTSIVVLDEHLQPVPMGVTAEIFVGGGQVTRGYRNREELTRQRFIPDPFSSDAGACLYRSGDLGCWRADGTLDYRGRNDAQVKIRGYRIELGEIESCLRTCAGVRDAVVVARDERDAGRRLVAYLVLAPDAAFSEADLRQTLAVRLADYMIPAVFVTLPALPLTANGKLDVRALPLPEHTADVTQSEPPQGDTEIRLARIWQSLLNIPTPGRRDHFFALGGHSLLAVQLNNAIKREFGVALPLRTVFELATIARLAAVIQLLLSVPEPADVTDEYEEGVFS